MRQIILPEFDLFLSGDVKDLFQWFGVNHLCGVTYAEAIFMDKFKEGFCSMVHYHPEDKNKSFKMKPFMFLNTHELSNISIHESALMIQGASFEMVQLLSGYECGNDETFERAEKMCITIITQLNFPKVFHRI
tara:strand:+ start:7644 stop:8042 length:399 start_codon:yes stop_codon:yes gene_type:complete